MSDDIEAKMALASQQQRFGATPPESDNEEEGGEEQEMNVEKAQQSSQQLIPERRYIDGKWLSYYGDDKFVEYIDNEWKPIPPESTNLEELKQKWGQAGGPSSQSSQAVKCLVNGVTMVWNPTGQVWIPDVDVNEDFLASYHSQYGVPTDYSSIKAPEPQKPAKEASPPLSKNEKRAKKRQAAAETAERLKGWIEMDQAMNTKVYVSGLPKSIKDEEYVELMSKYGIIMDDPRTGKPKIKLYRDEDGNLKGDGICAYVKVESVDLALQLLDGLRYDDKHTIKVEQAKFEIKGAYDPKKKKSRLSAAQKKKFLEKQEKNFEWNPDKPRNYRPPCERTVVLRNMFTLEEIDENAALILDLKEEMKELYSKFGNLKSVVVYDTNPEGVITLTYENVVESDLAVKSLDNIIRRGKQIKASLWDGKEKFKRQETDEEKKRRENAWQDFLGVKEGEEK